MVHGGKGGMMELHPIRCPSCGEDEAQLITFAQGHVVRCDACGLLQLTRDAEPDESPPPIGI